jgi:hypothetical protein
VRDALLGASAAAAVQGVMASCAAAADGPKKLQAVLAWLLAQPACGGPLVEALLQHIGQDSDAQLQLLALEALKVLAWDLAPGRCAAAALRACVCVASLLADRPNRSRLTKALRLAGRRPRGPRKGRPGPGSCCCRACRRPCSAANTCCNGPRPGSCPPGWPLQQQTPSRQ